MDPDLPPIVYDIGWAIWVLWFLALETTALMDNDRGDTLSEHVWDVMFQGDRPRPVIYYLSAGFFLWVFVHFLFRGRLG